MLNKDVIERFKDSGKSASVDFVIKQHVASDRAPKDMPSKSSYQYKVNKVLTEYSTLSKSITRKDGQERLQHFLDTNFVFPESKHKGAQPKPLDQWI